MVLKDNVSNNPLIKNGRRYHDNDILRVRFPTIYCTKQPRTMLIHQVYINKPFYFVARITGKKTHTRAPRTTIATLSGEIQKVIKKQQNLF